MNSKELEEEKPELAGQLVSITEAAAARIKEQNMRIALLESENRAFKLANRALILGSTMIANEMVFAASFAQMQVRAHEIAVSHGWWENDRGDGEAIALMHSELSEALEYLRKGNGQSDHIAPHPGAAEEFADVIIRIMDLAEQRGWDIASALVDKMAYNESRPYKHGGKAF